MTKPRILLRAEAHCLPREGCLLAVSGTADSAGDIADAWAIEAKRRLLAMRSGHMRCYSLAQVFGKRSP